MAKHVLAHGFNRLVIWSVLPATEPFLESYAVLIWIGRLGFLRDLVTTSAHTFVVTLIGFEQRLAWVIELRKVRSRSDTLGYRRLSGSTRGPVAVQVVIEALL